MIKIVDNLDFIGNISSGSDYIINYIDELKKEVELLKRKTNPEYAKECVVKELLEEYKKLVETDIWWEACREWIHVITERIIKKYDAEFRRIEEMSYYNSNGSFVYDGSFITSSVDSSIIDKNYIDTIINMSSFGSNDIILSTPNNRISINNLLNPTPNIEGYEFEKFVIDYCKAK